MIIYSVFKKNLISALRGEYIDFVISRITFILFTISTSLIVYQIYQQKISPEFQQYTGEQHFLGYIMIGSLLYGITHNVFLNVSRTLMTERRAGTLEAILLCPHTRWQYYVGTQLTQLFLTAIDILIILNFAMILKIPFHIDFSLIIPGFFLLWLTLFGISLLTSLLMIYLKDTFFIQNTILPILLLIGGYLFPIEFLPIWLSTMAKWLSLPQAIIWIKQGFLQGNLYSLDPVLFIIEASKTFIILILSFSLLKRIEINALENYLS
ncbi:MAG: ABC transporter permease [Spirochaetes bacterium]|nr:ABC transporter permease [Spirochaetota bacterium]